MFAAARAAGVDGYTMLAIAWVESGFNASARSHAGALGLMQLLPRTSTAFGCDDPERPTCAAQAAARFYARLLQRFDGRELYALCAYNAGAGRIARAWRDDAVPFNNGYAVRVTNARRRLKSRGCGVE